MTESIKIERNTTETRIAAELRLGPTTGLSIATCLPFFDHMLHAMLFHGGFSCTISATGDIEVDPHHLVEDVGLVLGQAVADYVDRFGPVARFGHSMVPMDDALSEVVLDLCGRPYLVYHADFPQPRAGDFDVSLVREFLQGFANKGKLNLHATCRYGLNSHHMIESLFKALGRALAIAISPSQRVRSTKGTL